MRVKRLGMIRRQGQLCFIFLGWLWLGVRLERPIFRLEKSTGKDARARQSGFPQLELSSPYLFRTCPRAEMLRRSASDVTTSGMYQAMRKSKTSDAGKRRLLLMGGSAQDFADLRELLKHERVHLEHAASAEDGFDQFGKGSYDLLLCSNHSTDDAAFQLLRQ